MKNLFNILFAILIINVFAAFSAKAQTSPASLATVEKPVPWTNDQLIEPADLVAMINAPKAGSPIIFNIGAVEDIKGARHIGPVSNAANLEKFKQETASLPPGTPVIIYCGCCPFTKCPNIRPAFSELKKMGFTQIKVLNLPVNLKTNWIAKGYPLAGT